MKALYRNIMVAVDNSELSNRAIDLAVNLAKSTGAKLTGNHVYAARLHDSRFRQLEPGLPERYQSEEVLQRQRDIHADLIGRGLRIISDSYLDVFFEKCRRAELMAEMKSSEGRNYEELVRDARDSKYDLIVIGAHGLGRVERSILGSVCERVTRLVSCDVLVTRTEQHPGSGEVLVAIDGSDESFAALRAATSLTRLYGSRMSAVAAYDPNFHTVAFKRIADVLSDDASRLFRFKEQERLHDEIIDRGLATVYHSHLQEAQRIAEAEDISLDIKVLEGKPFDVIASHVEKLRPSLLVVGRFGIHHSGEVTLGSTAENLVRLAGCNVLVVSHPSKLDDAETSSGDHLSQDGPHRNLSRPIPNTKGGGYRGADLPGGEGTGPTAGQGESAIRWSQEAEKRLERAPFFVRKMVRKRIEQFARENGHDEITMEVYEQARRRFGM